MNTPFNIKEEAYEKQNRKMRSEYNGCYTGLSPRSRRVPMSQEQILNMLEQGTITTEQAAQLLEAVSADEEQRTDQDVTQNVPSEEPVAIEPDQVVPGTAKPDAVRWALTR